MNLRLFLLSAALLVLFGRLLGASDSYPRPTGLRTHLHPDRRAVTLIWEPAPGETAGYNVYRRKNSEDIPHKLNSSPIPFSVYADRVDGEIFQYAVRAVNPTGTESGRTWWATSEPDGTLYEWSPSGRTHIKMPRHVAEFFLPTGNSTGEALSLVVNDTPSSASPEQTSGLQLTLHRSRDGTPVPIQGLSSAKVEVNFNTDTTPGSVLKVYWFNGVRWIPLSNKNKRSSAQLIFNTAYFGDYQIRMDPEENATRLPKENVYPRTFTPNGDGLNDVVYFVFENSSAADLKGTVYDLSGREVGPLKQSQSHGGFSQTLIWDGRDGRGAVAPAGEYIYRIDSGGTPFSGTISLLK